MPRLLGRSPPGRFVDVIASPDLAAATCGDQIVAEHARCWGTGRTITDPDHVAVAKALRTSFTATRARYAARATRSHADVVPIRALPDYDALFGVDFHTSGENPYLQADEGAERS
jgi:hypothetical protein